MRSMTLSTILSTNHKFSTRHFAHWRVMLLVLLPVLSLLAWNVVTEDALAGLPETGAKASPLGTSFSKGEQVAPAPGAASGVAAHPETTGPAGKAVAAREPMRPYVILYDE